MIQYDDAGGNKHTIRFDSIRRLWTWMMLIVSESDIIDSDNDHNNHNPRMVTTVARRMTVNRTTTAVMRTRTHWLRFGSDGDVNHSCRRNNGDSDLEENQPGRRGAPTCLFAWYVVS